jgi:hypothetical protein
MWLPMTATAGIGGPFGPGIATDFVSNKRGSAELGNARLREITETSCALTVGSFPNGPSKVERSTA